MSTRDPVSHFTIFPRHFVSLGLRKVSPQLISSIDPRNSWNSVFPFSRLRHCPSSPSPVRDSFFKFLPLAPSYGRAKAIPTSLVACGCPGRAPLVGFTAPPRSSAAGSSPTTSLAPRHPGKVPDPYWCSCSR